jgi:hypothetical protein
MTAPEEERGWGGYALGAWDKDSLAVIACDGKGNGAVLWTVGPHVRLEMDEGGLRDLGDLGLDDAPAGVSIWVGRYVTDGGGYCNEEADTYPKGGFRAPTDEEWTAIREGRCPWIDEGAE